ncbi:MAG TPA: ChbG/HpnK family deacetylase [Candidatus Acidoferrales bacterium]|nr:ChbG/HpnK family deacetylase [Candidatus Acidoferrales bacterium]
MRRLIVNADDFGFTRGVNAGIIRAHLHGILTSTTIMASGSAFEDAVALARANPKLGVGCHLVLVGGKAVSRMQGRSSLSDANGNLPSSLAILVAKLTTNRIRKEDIRQEIRAQIERVRSAGIEITHLDSHKHTHCHPQVMEALMVVAGEHGITRIRRPFESTGAPPRPRARRKASWKQRALARAARRWEGRFDELSRSHGLRSPDYFWGVAATGALNRQAILAIIDTAASLPEGTSELMCHPGEYDQDLEGSATRLKRERETELKGLVDASVSDAVKKHKIQLIDFRQL